MNVKRGRAERRREPQVPINNRTRASERERERETEREREKESVVKIVVENTESKASKRRSTKIERRCALKMRGRTIAAR